MMLFAVAAAAQVNTPAHSKTSTAVSTSAAEHAATLAETGHCSEALPLLTKSAAHVTDKELQKRVGLDGVRCANLLQEQGPLLDLLRVLNQHFPHDPEVLYVTVHAYSDLSTNAARELAQTAPTSVPALEMNAETNELQGKWDEAEKDYRKILAENPKYPGIHFRLARLLLSRPNPGPDFQDEAKKELQKELEIDPGNAGAEYVLGELARQESGLPRSSEALQQGHAIESEVCGCLPGVGYVVADGKELRRRCRAARNSGETGAGQSCCSLRSGDCLLAHGAQGRRAA